MKIIDGTGAILGRLASYVAKEARKGEEISVINCEKVIISGNKKMIEREFFEKRGRIGSGQRGPKHPKTSDKIVKRVIRGMIGDHREGKGREAFKRIRCYVSIPKEISIKDSIKMPKKEVKKYSEVKEFSK